MAIPQTIKKRVDALETSLPLDDKLIGCIRLVSPNDDCEPGIIWLGHPDSDERIDHRSGPDSSKSKPSSSSIPGTIKSLNER